MRTFLVKNWSMIVGLGCMLVAAQAKAADRPVEKILADINAIEIPNPPANRSDRTAVQDFLAKRQKAAEQKADLIGELYKSYPDSPEVPKLILERWQLVMMPGPKAAEMKAEMDDVLAKKKNEKLVTEAAFLLAFMEFQKAGPKAEAETLLPIAEEFIKRSPKDPRGAMFLSAVAAKTTEPAKQEELVKRIEKDFPESPIAQQKVAERRRKDDVGMPFEIEFNDAINGAKVSMESLKGKVVVVDFWATWCGPCVREMPKMKELYAKYKDKGVEFIGVSLDHPREQGGYEKLKSFVESNKIEWPQYYEGKFPASEFAQKWGIASIPAVFAIGADGKLFSTDARGKLEELIPDLLERVVKPTKEEAKP